jgi:hypothetical protein
MSPQGQHSTVQWQPQFPRATAQDFAPVGAQEAREALLPARFELCGSLDARSCPAISLLVCYRPLAHYCLCFFWLALRAVPDSPVA